MKLNFKIDIKTLLATIWLLFTLSLVIWWWIFVLTESSRIQDSTYRMIIMEGTVLIMSILLGGIFLVLFTYRDFKRHESLKLFFSNFSHDIKNSIARLRLQAEILQEESDQSQNQVLIRLVSDINRLELQLENSLIFANLENKKTSIDSVKLSEIVKFVRSEFSELQIEINQDRVIYGDKRALMSVIRNIFSNSLIHGKSEKIWIKSSEINAQQIEIAFTDNGLGYSGSIEKVGLEPLSGALTNNNGLGLHLSKKLIEKMGGQMHFASEPNKGFSVVLRLQGNL